MRSVTSTILACLLAAGLAVATPGAAEARKTTRDTPGCVTRWEFKHLTRGMAQAQVRALLDTPGRFLGGADNSYWRAGWVKDGHWVDDDVWVEEGHDENGTWVDTSHWESRPTWVDTTFWSETATYVSRIDSVRSYKKCRSFDRGRGRVGINFDNYSAKAGGMRVFSKVRSNPGLYFARTTDPFARKAGPPDTRVRPRG